MQILKIISSVLPLLQSKRDRFFRKNKKRKADEGLNVVAGISKAKALYKKLIVYAHPDKHPDNIEYYQKLTDRITANRYNYNELLKIEKELDNK